MTTSCHIEGFSFDLMEEEGNVMNIVLWIVQVLLALVFAAHAWLFLAPPPEIKVQMDANLPQWFQIFMGVAAAAAAIGLILPAVTRVMPFLVSWAAVGIMLILVSATGYHAVRGEYSSSVITFILLLMAMFVVYGRQRLRPIAARSAGSAAG
jgi:putative oxidoreductase